MKLKLLFCVAAFWMCPLLIGCLEPCTDVAEGFVDCPEANPIAAESCDTDCANCLIANNAGCDNVSKLLAENCSLRCGED